MMPVRFYKGKLEEKRRREWKSKEDHEEIKQS
jgi:hypothetical protein